jgi:hypothetical protein
VRSGQVIAHIGYLYVHGSGRVSAF